MDRFAKKFRAGLAVLFISGLITSIAGEIVARVLTRTTPYGARVVLNVTLLPYRVDPEAARRNVEKNRESTYVVFDDELGWTIGPNGESNQGRYRSNAQGVRTRPDRLFAPGPPPGVFRVVAAGDSFTHADELPFEQTWAAQLETLDGRIEVVNLGVPGYGTDQALLRWRRDGARFKPHTAFLGIWPENVCRNLNMNRFFLVPGQSVSPKPMFRLEGDELLPPRYPLESVETAINWLSNSYDMDNYRHDYWYFPREWKDRFYYSSRLLQTVSGIYTTVSRKRARDRLYADADPAGNDLTVAIARRFCDEAKAAGATPFVVIFPMRDLLPAYPGPGSLPLTAKLDAAGVPALDLFPVFAKALNEETDGELFLPSGHLSEAGNRLVAGELHRHLASLHAELH